MTDATQTTIRRMREAAGLSLRDLERLTGINRGRLSIIERGVVASDAETTSILNALTTANRDKSADPQAPAA